MIKEKLQGVKQVLAVASGKGGVGKTTVTVNLALALQQLGAKVGIFDADIYGPNVPLMLGIHRRRPSQGYVPLVRSKESKPSVKPLKRFNLHLMSVGFLMGENQLINPPADAVGQLVVQMLRDVIWPDLDYLLIDLPPSAGQPQEDLLRIIAIEAAVIVTTPQDLSLLDAARSLQMFQKATVPILGVVENMSYFICPNCDERHEIFHHSRRWQPEALADTPILGRVPLATAVSQGIHQATPLMQTASISPAAQAFLDIATHVKSKVGLSS